MRGEVIIGREECLISWQERRLDSVAVVCLCERRRDVPQVQECVGYKYYFPSLCLLCDKLVNLRRTQARYLRTKRRFREIGTEITLINGSRQTSEG